MSVYITCVMQLLHAPSLDDAVSPSYSEASSQFTLPPPVLISPLLSLLPPRMCVH